MHHADYDEYVQAALGHAECEFLLNDGIWYCEIPELPGVWADGDSKEECLEQLAEVVHDWLRLGFDLGHVAPPINGLVPNHVSAD